MAQKKISQLPVASAALAAMELEVNNAGTSESLTLTLVRTLVVAVGTTAPASPSTNDLWVDTN